MNSSEHSSGESRGFAAMDQQKRHDIASKGGRASGGNFRQDRDRAVEVGRRGGQNVPAGERSFARDRLLAAAAGRRGGERSRGGSGPAERGGGMVGSRHPVRVPGLRPGEDAAREPAHRPVEKSDPAEAEHNRGDDAEIGASAGGGERAGRDR